MDCPACGTDNREGAHFCRECGTALPQPGGVSGAPGGQAVEAPSVDTTPEAEAGASAATEAPEEPVSASLPEGPDADATAGTAAVPPASGAEKGDGAAEEAAPQVTGAAAQADASPDQDKGTEAPSQAAIPKGGSPAATTAQEIEPLAPVPSGTVVGGRYAVVKPLDVQTDRIRYLARDLKLCRQCGFEGNLQSDEFCAQCGATLEQRPEVELLEVRDSQPELPGKEAVAGRFTEGQRNFLLLAETAHAAEAPGTPPGSVRLAVGQRTDTGKVRELDEDSLFVLTMMPLYEGRPGPGLGLFAVADGMGGHEAGEVASRRALQVLVDAVLRTVVLPETVGQPASEDAIINCLREAVMAANDAVYLARQKRENDMGTTLTAALIRDSQLFLAHVGDCRAYQWNASGLKQLTTDHSLVASMIASGQLQPEEIYTHPHRSVIYRSIGDKPVVEVDTSTIGLTAGDRILLCSDGLWETVRNEGIEDVMMQEANPQAACNLLVSHANIAGGDDNISVIIVQVETG